MLKEQFKTINQAQDKKEIDHNDFWLIKDNPLTKVGIFPYLGRQISTELEPNTIYQVLRPEEELNTPETLKSFELIPLVDEHTMLGTKDGMQPAEKKGIHGVTGANVKFNNGMITNDLKIYSESLKSEIESGKKDLSVGYYCKYELTPGEYNGEHYDAIQRDVRVNHIALVDDGRMGRDVRVMDEKITFDTLSEILKENKMAEEKKTQAQDIDKRELLREADAIAMKPASEFEGGEEEKFRTLAKKLEEIAYKPSETGSNDEETDNPPKEGEDEDGEHCGDEEDPKNDNPAGDEEPQEPKNEGEDEDDKPEEEKPVSMDSAIKYIARRNALISKLKPVIGYNAKFSSMTIPKIVQYACDKLDLKPSLDTLEGYLKAKSRMSNVRVSLDNAITSNTQSNVIKAYLK